MSQASYEIADRAMDKIREWIDIEIGERLDETALENAKDYLRRGDIPDALIWLERALPAEFLGLADAITRYFGAKT
jgi:hypothetical protein